MVSGINTTFWQVGIATGIAVFGTLFATRITGDIAGGLRGTPLAARAHGIAAEVGQGQAPGRLRRCPRPPGRPPPRSPAHPPSQQLRHGHSPGFSRPKFVHS
jgi:hypothetical protein